MAARAVGGTGAQAAAVLGMNARTFTAKMEKWEDVVVGEIGDEGVAPS